MADPALVFEDAAVAAGTHVLLIGIGDYPWLEDGEECTTDERKEAAMGMGQLGAPPRSARALADWFLDGFDNPDKPLASLALILSEPDDAHYGHARIGAPKPVPRGTIGDVRDAVTNWATRANSNRGNAAVFAF